MKIITAPHQTLRQVATEITNLDKKVASFVSDLELTLKEKDNPKGVGLAAPQVDKKWRVFTTQLSPEGTRESESEFATELVHYINPVIAKHSTNLTFGPDKDEPQLEGCLSIPKIYAPVPRWEWVKLDYLQISGDKLVEKSARFEDFAARVVQHEMDHLNGILFTDYVLEYDLPFYLENSKTGKLEETFNKQILETL